MLVFSDIYLSVQKRLQQDPSLVAHPKKNENGEALKRKRFSVIELTKELLHLKKGSSVSFDILKGASGILERGELTALMGPSGGGKSSLFEVLSGQRARDSISGVIELRGKKLPLPLSSDDMSNPSLPRIHLVKQHDVLPPYLTPKEHLDFIIRSARGVGNQARRQEVEDLIDELGLQKCANSRIGTPGAGKARGLSGGERRRLSMAVELARHPDVLLIDEPTSGLDSASAEEVIDTLHRIASKGRIVAVSIHQPAASILAKFDSVIMLCRGRVVFQGPPSQIDDHFFSIGYPCPKGVGIPEHFLKLVSFKTDELGHLTNEEDWQRYRDLVKYAKSQARPVNEDRSTSNHRRTANQSWLLHLSSLSRRGFTRFARTPSMSWGRIMQLILIASLLGGVYWRVGSGQDSNASNTRDTLGAYFFVSASSTLAAAQSAAISTADEGVLVSHEIQARLYGPATQAFATISVDMVTLLPYPIFYGAIIFFMMGFTFEVMPFLAFLGVVSALYQFGSAIGGIFAMATPKSEVAVSMVPVVMVPFMLMSGFFVNISTVPLVLQWLGHISVFKYGFEALVGVQYSECFSTSATSSNTTSFCQVSSLHSFNIPLLPSY